MRLFGCCQKQEKSVLLGPNELPRTKDPIKYKFGFDNLVWEGGSSDGIVYIGAYKALYDHKIISNIKKIAGASIGALFATMSSIRADPLKLSDNIILYNPANLQKLSNTRDVFRRFGVYDSAVLEEFAEYLIIEQIQQPKITFAQIRQRFGTELTIISAALSSYSINYYSCETTPNMVVSQALRESMCFPGVFTPVGESGNWRVDGSLGDNYPLGLYDNKKKRDKKSKLRKTLGIKIEYNPDTVAATNLAAFNTSNSNNENKNVGVMRDYCKFTHNILNFAHIKDAQFGSTQIPDYWDRSIGLTSYGYNLLDHGNVPTFNKLKSIIESYNNTCDSLAYWSKKKVFKNANAPPEKKDCCLIAAIKCLCCCCICKAICN